MPKIAAPPGITAIGADNDCSLAVCPVEWSIYGYRPSLPANVLFAALFALVGLLHAALGARWRTWGFTFGVLLGCATEIIGYVGRALLWRDPFDYSAFMIQIVCLTVAPVFYTASIYITLSNTIAHLGPALSRFPPLLFYCIFIPADIVCLVLQAAGGAMSSGSNGASAAGENISMAGLALQVAVLVIFAALSPPPNLALFVAGLAASTLLILARCAYRVAELRDGYDGSLIAEEVPFIVLEGAVVALAAAALCLGHPGLVFGAAGAGAGKGMSDDEKDGPGRVPRYTQ
ncbi:Sphingoid long-chain base transporter RSB1 [Escovopsis weberi]|uniref:Sphingoid long-chain base transporter RSB1 n=1 Tax=Escovopsis weberi TaxID=150374 RepID=A0A0M8MU72_ESCWE|nr:Sphingoid long-chain base transporter RSB1 [Escovopsis weberi]